MRIRFLLGPAGSGKTFGCLAEIRAALRRDPEGPPLLLLAPKQATFQLERQLLAGGAPECGATAHSGEPIFGYTRLQILSFERLAEFVLDETGDPGADALQEEGRLMVLRALLGKHQSQLQLFHTTARLPGFARQLNLLLREFQRQQISPDHISRLAADFAVTSPAGPDESMALKNPALSRKLHDTALLLNAYLNWLRQHGLRDANELTDLAARALRGAVAGRERLKVGGLWLDGFAEMTPQELDLLTAFLPLCERATLAFCVDSEASEDGSWLSVWSSVKQTVERCHERVKAVRGATVKVEHLTRDQRRSRFGTATTLADLERNWAAGRVTGETSDSAAPDAANGDRGGKELNQLDLFSEPPPPGAAAADPAVTPRQRSNGSVRLVACGNPELEAVFAAREILRFVRDGGRFREAAVLLRSLEGYHDLLRRVFRRYDIPCFIDRREPAAHHPLAELTRYALRLAAFGWQHDDWFGLLKTGLVSDEESAIDLLENLALELGWQGNTWRQPITLERDRALEQSLNRWLKEILPPIVRWTEAMSSSEGRVTASELTAALRVFWTELGIEERLEQWSAADGGERTQVSAVHLTVFDGMEKWLENVELAFGDEAMTLAEWLPVLEAGLANLTVGVIPPALDQVLIGAIDRSRNPELKLVLLPGWNEAVFPPAPAPGPLLTDLERAALEHRNVRLGPGLREQLGRERFYGYIALTRARERVVVTWALQDSDGQPLNASSYLDLLKRLTGAVEEGFSTLADWRESEHLTELAAPVLRASAGAAAAADPALLALASHPALQPMVLRQREIQAALQSTRLSPVAAEWVYGRELLSSVSGLEDFAACPFKFFAARGLRLQERKEFQFDDRDKGSFQHEVLCEFHQRVRASGRRWRDLTVAEARELVVAIGRELLPRSGGGRFLKDGSARFTGELLIERLAQLMSALIEWLAQYEFDTEQVEVGFGMGEGLPAWRIPLPDGRALLLRGRIDRVDFCRDGEQTLAVVMDYKSSVRSLHPTRFHHGLELQLLSYLGVLRNLSDPETYLGVKRLVPAGVFYVPLNGGGLRGSRTRAEVLGADEAARRMAYQHSGRFLADALARFDRRLPDRGDQFRFARNRNGQLRASGNDAIPGREFEALREKVERHLREYGRRIFEGDAAVSPFRIAQEIACERCDFRSGCRFDSWTQPYRELRRPPKPAAEASGQNESGNGSGDGN